MESSDIKDRIRNCPRLPTLPAIAIEVLEMAHRPEVDIAEIARAISRDPALSGRILKTVNSSFYARSQAVGTISQALVILGLQSVKTLVLGFSLVSNLAESPANAFDHLTYWRRSIYAASAARIIAHKVNLVQQEEAFLAALLSDIGMLVLDAVLGAEYGEIYSAAKSHQELAAGEIAKLGISHADAGAVLAEQWKLPPVLTIPIAFSHSTDKVSDPCLKKLVELVELSGWCGDIFVSEQAAESIAVVRKRCETELGMNEAACDELLVEIGSRTKEVASLFDINIGASSGYEAILKKANEALVELTLQAQMRASALERQSQKLHEQATTDALTKLANRATLDRYLPDQIAATRSQRQPLTLLMLDLDRFKAINDTHGHQLGDIVLQCVAKILRTAARPQDLPARYGGEEMVLVLPGTSRVTGTAVAEAIRRAVEAKPVVNGKHKVPVTISIGVATAEPGGPLASAAHLIKAADMALYAAKRGGRNCVKVFSIKAAA
ncbi:MAG TPA: GGDEF domain-containing protein [Tepidisphaeraceae bacterium]|nr:GGDEF domain-containing protein [Tepidisphaeraceae bacterium]